MNALDQSKPKPLVVRLSPHRKLDDELRQQLKSRGVIVKPEDSLGLDSSIRSTLETFLWRDILYFLEKEYSEYTAVEKALRRLRENPQFVEALDGLTAQIAERKSDNG